MPWLLTVLYAAIYFALGTIRYAGHRNYVDLGIFTQTAASAFGCFCNPIEGSHWAFHFSPILYVAGALMLVWKSPLALVALQAIAGALTIAPVYGIVRRRADLTTARLAAMVVFLYAPLGGVVFNDFHENGIAPAAVAWLLWAFDGGHVAGTYLFALLVLSVKEDQAIFLFLAALAGAWRCRGTRMRRVAAIIALVSLLVGVVFFAYIQPHAVTQAHWAPTRFYDWSMADLRALVPAGLLQRLGFILLAFVPLLFLPFRSRAMWLAAAPLAEVLLSRMSTTYTLGSHYAGAWIGWVLFAFALAVRGFAQHDAARTRTLLYACMVLCALEFAVADPLHPRLTLHAPTTADATLDRFLQTLPRDASVATQEEAYTHLAASDPNATLLPETSRGSVDACFILTDEAFAQSPRLVESRQLVSQLVAADAYRVTHRDGAITLYRSARCR